MRIAVWHDLPRGGGHRALAEQLRGLRARGHEIDVFAPARAHVPLGDIDERLRALTPTVGRPRSAWGRQWETLVALRALDRHARGVAREIDAGGYDVVFANTARRFHVAPLAGHLRTPALLYLQEPCRVLYESFPGQPDGRLDRVTHAVQARRERRAARDYARVLVNSDYSMRLLHRVYGVEARVARLGVDAAHFRPGTEPREPFVLAIGALQWNKGADRVVRSLATLPREARPPLLWAGHRAAPRFRREVETLAHASGVTLEIRLDPSDAELVALLGRAALLVHAARREPFGLVALEAAACETPVVSVDEGGAAAALVPGETGLLVPADDPKALAGAISELVSNPERARTLGVAGRAYVLREWSWEGAVDVLERELAAVALPRRA